MQHVVLAHPHGLELDAGAPHHGVLELVDDRLVDLHAEVLDGAGLAGLAHTAQDDWLLVVRELALRLRVDTHLRRRPMTGVRSQESGVRSQESGVRRQVGVGSQDI